MVALILRDDLNGNMGLSMMYFGVKLCWSIRWIFLVMLGSYLLCIGIFFNKKHFICNLVGLRCV